MHAAYAIERGVTSSNPMRCAFVNELAFVLLDLSVNTALNT